jgi:hypothetical protein
MRCAMRWMLAVGTILLISPFWAVRAADTDEMIANPPYQHWASFKPGSTVTLAENTVFGESQKHVIPEGVDEKVITYTLLSVTPESAVVQVVVTEREFLSFVESAPTKKIFPAKVKKAYVQAFHDEVGAMNGEESLEVLGKKVTCKTLTSTIKKDAEVVENKIWRTETVPGGIVKRTRVTKQDGKVVAETTITLKSFKKAD